MHAASILQRQNARTAKDSGVPGLLRHGPASRKGRSSLPACVACLLTLGWGQKRIVRHTGFAKTTIGRFAKMRGINLSATAEQKKASEMAVRKRKDGMTASEWREAVGWSETTFRRKREAMLKAKLVRFTSGHFYKAAA